MNEKSGESGLSEQLRDRFNEEKVTVLFLADPSKFLDRKDNKIVKLLFDFEYLCEEFDQNYQIHHSQLSDRLLSLGF